MSRPVGLVPGSRGLQQGTAATVSRSSGASEGRERSAAEVRRCPWPLYGRLFVPRATGAKPQKWCSGRCRDLATAAARARCPRCVGSLARHGDLIKRERFAAAEGLP